MITDDNTLLVLWSFLHPNSASGLLISVDGSTGALTKSIALGEVPGAFTVGGGLSISPLPTGRFLLQIGDELRIGHGSGLDFELRRTVSRSALVGTPNRSHPNVYVSPSGKIIVFVRPETKQQYRIDPKTLEPHELSGLNPGLVGITDRKALSTLSLRGGDVPAPQTLEQVIGEAVTTPLCASCQARAIFGSDLVLLSNYPEFWIIDQQGRVVYRVSKNIGFRSAAVAGSARSNRVAFSYRESKQHGDAFRVGERIEVLDVDRKKDVLNLELEAVRSKYPRAAPDGQPGVGLALSPDGKRLAVLRGSVLQYFALD